MKPEAGLASTPVLTVDCWRWFRQSRPMPRTMRVECPGAIHHVRGRGYNTTRRRHAHNSSPNPWLTPFTFSQEAEKHSLQPGDSATLNT